MKWLAMWMHFKTQDSKVRDFENAVSEILDIFRVQAEASFVNSSLSCSSPFLTFSSTLVYSSDDGSLTATNLINLIRSQLTSTENATITVSGVQLLLHEAEDNESPTTCIITVTSPSFLSVGLFFGGFVSASLIFIVVIIILIMWDANKCNMYIPWYTIIV